MSFFRFPAMFLGLAGILVPKLSLGQGNKAQLIQAGITAALAKFQKDDPSSVPNIAGSKGWVDGDKVQVKVYLSGNFTLRYSCHEMNQQLMCDKLP